MRTGERPGRGVYLTLSRRPEGIAETLDIPPFGGNPSAVGTGPLPPKTRERERWQRVGGGKWEMSHSPDGALLTEGSGVPEEATTHQQLKRGKNEEKGG